MKADRRCARHFPLINSAGRQIAVRETKQRDANRTTGRSFEDVSACAVLPLISSTAGGGVRQ